MARYIATVEYDAGEYWISFPGIEKAGSRAKRPEDIVPHARAFLDDWVKPLPDWIKPDNPDDDITLPVPPASLDDALTDPREPFKGTKLVIFEWEPPR